MKNRFDKTKPPKRDPEARLGVMIHFKNPFQKEPQYFWGYRNHSITDCDSELPVWQLTKPANVQDTTLFIPIFKKLLEHFNFDIQAVMADAAYDSEDNLKFVIDNFHALPRIARNLRWEKLRKIKLSFTKEMYRIDVAERIAWEAFRKCLEDGDTTEEMVFQLKKATDEDDPAIGHHDNGSHLCETDDIPHIPHVDQSRSRNKCHP